MVKQTKVAAAVSDAAVQALVSVDAVEKTLEVVKAYLVNCILATPSGNLRNHLSDANIHVEAALDQIRQAMEGR